MKKHLNAVLFGWSFVSLALLQSASPLAAAPLTTPVVVELFESQGCSSCPPSERVMKDLRRQFGASVILLTFHVDYWDSLGWKDTFSSHASTDRQKMYGRLFHQDSIYTPEMVVQGETGFVGSDQSRAVEEVRRRVQTPRPALDLKAVKNDSGAVVVSVRLPPDFPRNGTQLTVVVCEEAAPVNVLRGENAGVTMSGNFAVRKIMTMALPPEGSVEATLPPGKDWDIKHLQIAVLADAGIKGITAAQIISWP